MGKADEFFDAFFKQYPQAQSGELSIEEVNQLLSEFQRTKNNTPLDDFDCLTPLQMGPLLYEPFSDKCLLQLNQSIESFVERVPLFILAELLLSQIKTAGKLKLTAKGNLPVRVCELLLKEHLIKWEYMKYMANIREEEIPYIRPLKYYLLGEGLVKKLNNTLSLTRKGEQFINETKTKRFTRLLLFFGTSFRWDSFYYLPDHGKCGQLGWTFSLLLLLKYGDIPRESEFYSSKLIQAFEKESLADYSSDALQKRIEGYHRAYAVRFFECFANWFGFVNIEKEKNPSVLYLQRMIVTKTSLLDDILSRKLA